MFWDKTQCFIQIAILATNIGYSVIAPFLPLEYHAKGVSTDYLGLTLSTYALCFATLNPIIGSSLSSIGRKRAILVGSALLTLAFLSFPCVQLISNPTWFLSLTLVVRITQGVGGAFVYVAAYSIAASSDTDDLDTVMAMTKLSVGIGLVSGPSIGSLLYSIAGFNGPFLFFAAFFAVLTFFAHFVLPHSVDLDALLDDSEASRLSHSQQY